MPRPTWLAEGDVRGTEHVGPNDTFDADYGVLLDRAEGLVRPHGGFDPLRVAIDRWIAA